MGKLPKALDSVLTSFRFQFQNCWNIMLINKSSSIKLYKMNWRLSHHGLLQMIAIQLIILKNRFIFLSDTVFYSFTERALKCYKRENNNQPCSLCRQRCFMNIYVGRVMGSTQNYMPMFMKEHCMHKFGRVEVAVTCCMSQSPFSNIWKELIYTTHLFLVL